jgi:hypothetical protein
MVHLEGCYISGSDDHAAKTKAQWRMGTHIHRCKMHSFTHQPYGRKDQLLSIQWLRSWNLHEHLANPPDLRPIPTKLPYLGAYAYNMAYVTLSGNLHLLSASGNESTQPFTQLTLRNSNHGQCVSNTYTPTFHGPTRGSIYIPYGHLARLNLCGTLWFMTLSPPSRGSSKFNTLIPPMHALRPARYTATQANTMWQRIRDLAMGTGENGVYVWDGPTTHPLRLDDSTRFSHMASQKKSSLAMDSCPYDILSHTT